MEKMSVVGEQEKCVECTKAIPAYRKFFCEPCFVKMLQEPTKEELSNGNYRMDSTSYLNT